MKAASHSVVWKARGGLFHLLGARRVKSLDACLLCSLRDYGTIRAVLEGQRERGADQCVISALR